MHFGLNTLSALLAIPLALAATASQAEGEKRVKDPQRHLERTSFQTGGPYRPETDIKSDVAMVYGINGNVEERMKGWKDHGYIIHLMTGVAWGEYQDYIYGKWDGKSHEDEAQMDRNGNLIQHGPTVPYIAPSETYGKYLTGGVKRAIDAGAEAIYLEEPEFWVRGGYSESFKREWQSYYHEPWIAPHTTPDAQYRASKLKYFLYRRALQQVFSFVVDYGKQIGREIKCYVPTHSMISYAQWRIVSPEQSLVQLRGCDGYIGQVWTGTARTPNFYKGVFKERTFETGFFEYGILNNLVRSTGRRMYFLNDPVEDNPDHTWTDYRRNWECTLVASLLWPDVWHYEVAPWPERPFMGKYPVKEPSERQPGEPEERVGISPEYSTELMTVFNALNDMNQPKTRWECGTRKIGILISDTMMFQRGDPQPSDSDLSSFYGIAMPLLKRGIPVQPVQLENAGIKDYLKPYDVLFLTYEGMKPPAPELHDALTKWVKAGGILVFVDDDSDPYDAVKEWWNSDGNHYETPRIPLFEKLGLDAATGEGARKIGKGELIYRKVSPASLAKSAEGAATTLDLAKEACDKAGLKWKETDSIVLRRGPYVVAAGLDETGSEETKTLKGRFIDLFDPELKTSRSAKVAPGDRLLLLDMDKIGTEKPKVLAAASKILDETDDGHRLRFHTEGPINVTAAVRIALPHAPVSVKAEGAEPEIRQAWDAESGTLLLEYPNAPDGFWIEVAY